MPNLNSYSNKTDEEIRKENEEKFSNIFIPTAPCFCCVCDEQLVKTSSSWFYCRKCNAYVPEDEINENS